MAEDQERIRVGLGGASTLISVGIVEDDPLLQRELVATVASVEGLRVGAVAATLADGLHVLDHAPDVILLDVGLPDGSGLELIERARQRPNPPKILVLTVFADVRTVVRALERGADGYLLKDAGMAGIGTAIRTVLSGGAPISPAVAAHVLARLRAAAPARSKDSVLTPRETSVLESLASGKALKEVAVAHGISAHTVGDHVKAIYRKLAVNSRTEAVYKAVQSGLIDLR